MSNIRTTSRVFPQPVVVYGVDNSGIDDVGAKIQAAIDNVYAMGGGEVTLPRGRYKIQAAGLVLRDNVVLTGAGRSTVIESVAGTADFATVSAIGTLDAAQALASDAAKGATTLTVTGLTGVVAGRWLRLNSSLSISATLQKQGEIVRVQAVAGDTITLYDPICDNYATSNGAQIEPINPVTGAGVRGIRFLGPVSTTFLTTGIYAELCHDLSISDCAFENTQYRGVGLINVWGSRVRDSYFRDITKAGLAYGVVLGWACQDVLISGLIGERMRHLVSFGGGSLNRGIPRRCTAANCTASNMMEAGFDCHPAGEEINFDNCHVLGSDVDGFMFQGASGSITNSTARNCGRHGLVVQPLTTRPLDVTINGFKAIDCPAGMGVAVTTTLLYGVSRSLKIKNITASGCIDAVLVDASATGGLSGVEIDGVRAENCSSYDVVVSDVAGFSIRGLNCQSVVRGLVLTNASKGVVSGLELESAGAANYAIQCTAVTDTVFSAIKATGYTIGLLFNSSCNTNTIDVSADFRGCVTPTSLSSGLNNLTGIRSDDSRLAAISVSASYIEQRRTSNCFTLPITSGGTPLGALATGGMLAALAYSLIDGTFTKIAWAASTGTITALTDFRLGVWDITTGAYLAQTANESASCVANTLMTFNLLSSVILVAGQPLLLTIGGVGTTLPVIRGTTMGSAQASRLTLAGYKSCTLASGWAGGTLPSPGAGSTGGIPWIELMP